MSKPSNKSFGPSQKRIIGAKAFAAISKVEGLELNRESKSRLDALKASPLSPSEKRAEVLRAYSYAKGRK